jgi:hypothetical protein
MSKPKNAVRSSGVAKMWNESRGRVTSDAVR